MRGGCPTCGAAASEDDRFCARCGTALEDEAPLIRFCTVCGTQLEVADRFCPRCGTSVRGEGDEDDDRPLHDPLPEEIELTPEEEDLLADWEIDPEAEIDETLDTPIVPGAPLDPELEDVPRGAPAAWAPPTDAAITETIATPRTVEHTATLPAARPAPPKPSPRPAPVPTPPRPPYPWGATFAVLGGVLVIVSSVVAWGSSFGRELPRDIPAVILLDPDATRSGVSLGVMLLVVGATGALIALVTMVAPVLRFLRRLVGVLTLAVPIGFAMRTLQADATGGLAGLPEELGAGVYLAAAGALVQVLAGKWFRR